MKIQFTAEGSYKIPKPVEEVALGRKTEPKLFEIPEQLKVVLETQTPIFGKFDDETEDYKDSLVLTGGRVRFHRRPREDEKASTSFPLKVDGLPDIDEKTGRQNTEDMIQMAELINLGLPAGTWKKGVAYECHELIANELLKAGRYFDEYKEKKEKQAPQPQAEVKQAEQVADAEIAPQPQAEEVKQETPAAQPQAKEGEEVGDIKF